jgi:hypothetical protein
MNCRKTIRQLPAYLDRELSRQEVSELEQHLEVCVFCSTELASLRATSKMLDAWEDISPRRSYAAGVVGQVRAEEAGVTGRCSVGMGLLGQRWFFSAARVAGVVMILLGATVLSVRTPVVERATEEAPGAAIADLESARALLVVDEDFIKPSEHPLLTGASRRGPGVGVSPRGLRVPGILDGDWFSEGVTFPVNHVYSSSEGMPVEAVIPITRR